jgi:hypothetical protein
MPTGASATEAQEDALARLRKRHKDAPGVLVSHFDPLGRMVVMLPGEESITRRRRFITRSGVVESRV